MRVTKVERIQKPNEVRQVRVERIWLTHQGTTRLVEVTTHFWPWANARPGEVESISFSALKDFWPNKDELLRFLGNRYRRDFAVWKLVNRNINKHLQLLAFCSTFVL